MRRLALLVCLSFAACAPPMTVDAALRQLEAAPEADRAELANVFWERVDQTPLITSDTTAVLLWKGEAESVSVLGDMGEWAEALPLTRLAGTDIWHRQLELEPDARLEYLFMVDEASEGFGAELLGVPDPKNPNRVLSGFGPFSELAMPGYPYDPVFDPVRDGTPGSFDGLDRHTLPEGVLPYVHEIAVYTPPEGSGEGPLPLVVFTDGFDYVEFAHVPAVLDDLIRRGEIEPVVAAFVDPPNRHGADAPNRTTEYGFNDAFVAFLADELVPFLDAHYPTRRDPAQRLIVGASYGGLNAVYTAFQRSDVFGLAYSQSGYHSLQADRMIRQLERQPVAPIRLVVDIGTYEGTVGAGWLDPAETDFVAANRRLRDALEARGYDVLYAEQPEGHTWGNWRGHVPRALRHFFPAASR